MAEQTIAYQVALFIDGSRFNCGGSIISPLLILTAAHCLDKYYRNPQRVTVIAGTRVPSPFGLGLSPSEQIRQPQRFYIHQGYSRQRRDNAFDIGIIELSEPLEFTTDVHSVCLPNEYDELPGKAMVSGWGRTDPDDPSSVSKFLQFLVLSVIPFQECRLAYGSKLKLHMFCLGSNDNQDSCQGDSGGPAVCKRMSDNTQVLCGVVSWGKGCAQKRFPGVYTKVEVFRNWIDQTLPYHLSSTINCDHQLSQFREADDNNPSNYYDYVGDYGDLNSGVYDEREGHQDGYDDSEAFSRSASYVPTWQDIQTGFNYNDGYNWGNDNGEDSDSYL